MFINRLLLYYRYRAPECLLTDCCYIIGIEPLNVYKQIVVIL